MSKDKVTKDVDAFITTLKVKKEKVYKITPEYDLLDEVKKAGEFGFKDLLENSGYAANAFETLESPQSWWNRFMSPSLRENKFSSIPTDIIPIHECGGLLFSDVTIDVDENGEWKAIFPWSSVNVAGMTNLAARALYAGQQSVKDSSSLIYSNFYFPEKTDFDDNVKEDYFISTGIIKSAKYSKLDHFNYAILALTGYSVNVFGQRVAMYEIIYSTNQKTLPANFMLITKDRDMQSI